MDWRRLHHTIMMCLIISPMKRAEYLRKHAVFHRVGVNCMVMFRKVPLYSELISLGDNVWIASNVSLITHDVIHHMLNFKAKKKLYTENIGCINILDNVFIGANSTILSNVTIGPDTIIGANSLVNKSVGSGVYAGVPVKYICSIEDYQKKKQICSDIQIERKSNGGLSDETIDEYWKKINIQDN